MYLTVRGLVLRVVNYKDTDALLTVLTEKNGKLTIKARGLRRRNSPLIAACQLLAFAEFTLFESKGFYSVNEARSIELFHPLRQDLVKLSLGTYFAQVAEVLSQEDFPNPELLSLTLNCLYALSHNLAVDSKVKAAFELRSACLAGYAPDLSGCHSCGKECPDMFDISQGMLECSRCRLSGDGIRMPVTPGVLDTMRFICFCEPKRIFAFQVGDETLEQLSQITEGYLSAQLERGFSTLDFYKSLLAPYCNL